jgi:hypothetical protein
VILRDMSPVDRAYFAVSSALESQNLSKKTRLCRPLRSHSAKAPKRGKA